MKTGLVEVRPITTDKWHGKKNQEDFSQPIAIRALYSHDTGKYAINMTEEQLKEYGDMLGINLDPIFKLNEPHDFYDSTAGKIKLPFYPIFLDPKVPMEFVKIAILKGSKLVANSQKDYDNGLFPEATHVIYDENEHVEVLANKFEKKRECYTLSSNLTEEQLSNILSIIVEKPMKGRSKNFLNKELDKIIEETPDVFLRYAKMDKEESFIRALLLEALYRDMLIKEGNTIFYMGDKIADTFEDAIKYFLNPQNQQLKISLLEKIKA